jgi:hypothetical protein
MNDTEREAVIFNSAWEMIDGMVNWAIFEKTDRSELSNLWFPSGQHRQLYLILLADFLSQTRGFRGRPIPLGLQEPPSNTTASNRTFLFHLREVCNNPILGLDASGLRAAVEAFAIWLEHEFVTEGVNLCDIDVVCDVKVSRLQYIKICGDIAKHNLARLEANVKRVRELLAAAGNPITEDQGYLAIPSFNEWFATGIFPYHASHIAELLNNIRWEIYWYLQPEFRRSWHRKEEWTELYPRYGYHVPPAIEAPVARNMYWDAMNRSRSVPYVQRFTIPAYAKTEY